MTDYYNHGSVPATNSNGDSSVLRAEFDAIQNGISNKLPPLLSNNDKVVVVNPSATGLTTIATTGTGAVVRSNSPTISTPTGLVKGDVGLGNVDNTSDADKPVSTAQATAINAKANKGANNDITSLSGLTTALSIAQGGTGAMSQAAARTALGSTATGDALFVAASASAAQTTLDVYSKAEVYTKSETDTKLDNPAFSAYVAANQTITSSTYTKVNFDTEEFDIGSCYDTTLKRWTPNKPGYYYVGGFFNNVNSTGLSISVASVYKNGASFKQVGDTRGSLTGATGGGCFIYLNGTDYIEFYSYITATTAVILGGATTSVFYGYFVRT